MSYKPGSGSGPGISGDHLVDTATPGPIETTVALWVRQDAPVTGAGAIANLYLTGDPDNSPHWAVQFYENGRLRLTEFNTNVISTLSVGNGWHRLVYICDVGAGTQTQWIYVDGALFATLTGNSAYTPAFEAVIAFGNTAPDAAIRRFFSWTAVKTLASLDAQWITDTVGDSTNLWRATPLDTDLLDDSGAGHHWTIAQTVTQIADAPDLGFPRVMAVANSNGTTPGAGVALTMPAGIVAGELLICWATNDTPGATNLGISGWTQVQQTAASATAIKHAIFAKLAVGSDTATLTGAAQDYVATVARIQNHGVTTIASDIKVATAATGTDAAPNPPSLDTGTSKKYLWLASNGADDDDIPTTFPLEPSGFTGLAQVFSATGTTSCMQQVAHLSEAAQTKDPGAFKLAAAEEWAATTIAIPPASAGGGVVAVTGSAAGLSTAAGTARARVSAASTVGGAASAAGVARARVALVGASAGLGSAAGVAASRIVRPVVGLSSGLSTAAGTARARARTAGSSAGLSTAAASSGQAVISATTGTAAGLAVASATARAVTRTTGSVSASASVAGTSRIVRVSVGASAGVATTQGLARAVARVTGTSAAAALVDGRSSARQTVRVVGLSSGSSVAVAYSRALADALRLTAAGVVPWAAWQACALRPAGALTAAALEPVTTIREAGIEGSV